MNKFKQQGNYSVEFALTFVIFLGILLLSIDISRMMISRSIIDLKFREMTKLAQNDLYKPLSRLQAETFHKGNAFFYDAENIHITITNCIDLVNYQLGCTPGRGLEQHLVRYQLDYQFPTLFLGAFLKKDADLSHKTVIFSRNEPHFEKSKW